MKGSISSFFFSFDVGRSTLDVRRWTFDVRAPPPEFAFDQTLFFISVLLAFISGSPVLSVGHLDSPVAKRNGCGILDANCPRAVSVI
jgi:hypothetical protein